MQETQEKVAITHEMIVEELMRINDSQNKVASEEQKLKETFKSLRSTFKQVQKSVASDIPKVAYLVAKGINENVTTNGKLAQDSGVHKTTISRFHWIGSTLEKTGVTKTSEKLASKTLNLLSQNKLGKADLEGIKEVEDWKELIASAQMPTPKGVSTEKIKDSILNGFNDDELDDIVASIELRKQSK